MAENEPIQAWVLRLGEGRLVPGLERNFVSIGWSDASGLDTISDWEAFKARILETHPFLEGNNRALGNGAGTAWRFIHEMKPGDLVVVPTTDGFYIAEIKGEERPMYVPDSDVHDASWRRPVEWKTRSPLPRDYLDNYARRRLKARQTCVSASEFVDEFQAALTRAAPQRLLGTLREALRQDVATHIDHLLDSVGLERLVCALAAASGAKATRQSTRQPQPGDVDVLATLPLPVPELYGEGPSEIRIGYQVKHHDDTTGAEGIAQLLQPLRSEDIDVGYLVTSAAGFSEEVINEVSRLSGPESPPSPNEGDAVSFKIGLINRDGLAQWVLDVGLQRLEEHMPE